MSRDPKDGNAYNPIADLFCTIAEKLPSKSSALFESSGRSKVTLKDYAVILNSFSKVDGPDFPLGRKVINRCFEACVNGIAGKIALLEELPKSESMLSDGLISELEETTAHHLSLIANAYARTSRRILSKPIFHAII